MNTHKPTAIALITLGIFAFLCPSGTGPAYAGDPPAGDDKATKFPNPETARLESLIGVWTVMETHYDTAGQVIGTVKGTEEIGWMLDHHAIRRVYTIRRETNAYRAIGTLMWNTATKSYRGYWVDNGSTTGPMSVEGTWSDESGGLLLKMETLDADGSTLPYQVVEKREGDDFREATTFKLVNDTVIKLITVVYKRSIPCPSGPRPVGITPIGEGKLAPGEPKRPQER